MSQYGVMLVQNFVNMQNLEWFSKVNILVNQIFNLQCHLQIFIKFATEASDYSLL